MPDNNDKADKRRKMVKRVETKEDGRFLIFYTFEQDPSATAECAKSADAKAVRK
jgi:hypothetical protein